MSGDIRSGDTADTVVVSLNNGSASKTDYFIEGNVDCSVVLPKQRTTDSVRGTVAIDITYRAPATGYPEYVIGNQVGMPAGHTRLLVTVMTGITPIAVLVDGQHVEFVRRGEAGLRASNIWIDIPPGGTRRVVVALRGPLNLRRGWGLTTRTPPTASVWTTSVTVRDETGVLVQDTRQQHGFVEWPAG